MRTRIIAALNRHKGFMRGEMGHMISTKFTPDLRFVEDDSFAEAEKIENLLKSPLVQRDLVSSEESEDDSRCLKRSTGFLSPRALALAERRCPPASAARAGDSGPVRKMGKRKKGNPVHGWVILDKPSGITSTQAVATVRRIFDAQKAGHAGTLDPLATGILAIALGEATKTVPYVQDAAKIYRFTATLGRGARQRRCRRQGDRDHAMFGPPRPPSKPCCPASPAP